ncbi:MAG: protoporphyrinogen oxidase, partial [Acidobacteriota bacterium]
MIVGAGIAGLACAARLLDLSRERGRSYDLTVLDSAPRAGGVISTEHRDGFLVEKGPDCFITEKPWALDLCRRLGLEDQLIGTNPDCRRSFVLLRGRILPIPEGYQLMAPGRLWPFATTPILSLAGKLRAACDLILPRGAPRNDESLASFVRRRFGSEVL